MLIYTYGRTNKKKFSKLVDDKPSFMLSKTKSLVDRIVILTY